jgi:hypothetical protein
VAVAAAVVLALVAVVALALAQRSSRGAAVARPPAATTTAPSPRATRHTPATGPPAPILADAFIGVWKGQVTQHDGSSAAVTAIPTVRLHHARVGDRAGSYLAAVPGQQTCRYGVTLQRADRTSAELTARVSTGPDCGPGTLELTLRDDAQLGFLWVAGSTTASGTLSRT